MKSKTIYKRGGVTYKTMSNGIVQVYNLPTEKAKQTKQAIKQAAKKKAQKPTKEALAHVSNEDMLELQKLVESGSYTTLKQRINTLAGVTICSTCPGSNSQAKAIVEHEMSRRQIN